jgi:hypothetical protein
MRLSEYGVHSLVVYPDMNTLRRIYSYYAKMQLEDNNELVLILPYYETTETVRSILSEDHSSNGGSVFDVSKYEKEGSLVIIDSAEAYFTSDTDLMSFVARLAKKAQSSGKNGISVIADLASFSYFNRIDKLIEYEMSLPTKYDDDNMKLKGFCFYHQEDFDRRLSKEEKQKLLEHHGKALIAVVN